MKLFLLLFFCLISTSATWADSSSSSASSRELTPHEFLLKISKRLTEKWPDPSEYTDLQEQMNRTSCKRVSCLESYFRKIIRKKMEQDEFFALFYSKVTERWGYKTPTSLRLETLFNPPSDAHSMSARRDFGLIYYILQNNLSFDEIFKSQLIVDPNEATDLDLTIGGIQYSPIDLDGFKHPMSLSKKEFNYTIQRTKQSRRGVIFDLTGHKNVAGLFSSSVYWNRYWNTGLNQERKRAAHFFKVMLCDSMSPALDRETEKQRERRLSLGIFDEAAIKQDLQMIHRNKHASQKDCAACHSRLDPVGYSFRAIENGVSNYPVQGILKYQSAEGLSSIKTTSLNDLISKTTQLPQYLDCQMNWLIESYLGSDLKLSTSRFTELGQEIDSKKRRIKDVIETLLMTPEFWGGASSTNEPESLIRARKVLSNCTDCHSNFFNLRPDTFRKRLERIVVCLDLKNDGSKAAMPPSDHYWFPSTEELKHVRDWILLGAPLTQEFKLFDSKRAQEIMFQNHEASKCRD